MNTNPTPRNPTAVALLIVTLIYGIVIVFFGQHRGNSPDDELSNCLGDGNNLESCIDSTSVL